MLNDLGGAAKTLWSVDNDISTAAYTANGNYAPADLLTKDTVYTSTALGDFYSPDTSLLGAKIWINSDGTIGYDASSLTAQLQALGAGETLIDYFTYAIRLGNGTLSWATAAVKFGGVNDAPVAVADVNAVKEDTAPNPVSGNVLTNDTDVDTHDTHSVTAAQRLVGECRHRRGRHVWHAPSQCRWHLYLHA